MPDYSANDPKGWCGDPSRGAALGRPTVKGAPADFAGKITVQRVHLDQGGYDRNGTYFGSGEGTEPLYWCADEEGTIDYCLRAKDLESAKRKVSADYPHATLDTEETIGDAVDLYDPFFAAYVECALWSSMDQSTESGGEPLDENYGPDDIADETLREMWADCRDFRMGAAAPDLVGIDPSQAGHDFWLTRNRHGAGFWDRGLGERGDRLTKEAHAYGGVDLYVGDDGKIYA